jgi:excisionase family DNA binding protein
MRIEPLPVPAMPTMPLMEVDRVAYRMSVSPEFVRRLLRSGKLVGIRVGRMWRVDPREVQAYIERLRRAASGAPLEDRRRVLRES